MAIRKRWTLAALGAAFALGLTWGIIIAPVARAASSFTYRTFQTLIGGSYVVPTATSLSYATQLNSPTVTAPTAPSSGSLTAGPLQIEIAAVSATGTSTPSSEIATTSIASGALYFSWAPVPGATGYALYFGTSTPGSEGAFFMATSTSGAPNTNYTLTSTSSPTYYAIPAQGSGYYSAFGSASTTIDTGGLIRSSTSATTTCNAAATGAMFYNPVSDLLWLCKAGGWTVVK